MTHHKRRVAQRTVCHVSVSHVGCSLFSKQTPTSPTNLPGRPLCSVQVYIHGGVACAWTRPTVTAQRPRPQKRCCAAHVSTPEAQLHPTHTDTREFLAYFRAIRRHSGAISIDPELMGYVLIPYNWKEYIHHRGCSFSIQSVLENVLIPGGHESDQGRQTVFFTPLYPFWWRFRRRKAS